MKPCADTSNTHAPIRVSYKGVVALGFTSYTRTCTYYSMCLYLLHTCTYYRMCLYLLLLHTCTYYSMCLYLLFLHTAKIEGNALRADQKLYNDLIDCIESTEARWPHQSLCTGQSFSKALSAALWYVDPHHHTLRERGITLPGMFLKFNGYNDYKRKKEKKPKLSQLGLNHHVQQLSDFLSQPWFCRSIYSELCDVTEQLVEGMRKYELYLRGNSERASNTHHHTEVIRSPFDNIVMKTIPSTSEIIKSEYSKHSTNYLIMSRSS